MFDELLKMVKQQVTNNPQVASSMSPAQQQQVSHDVANQITSQLANQAPTQGGIGGLLQQLQNGLTSNNPIVNAVEGGVVSSLGSKFGLPPAVTGAIAASLPGLLQKFAHKANDPNDHTVTHDGISDIFSKVKAGGLGSLFPSH